MLEPTHVLMFALALLSAGLGFGLPRLLYRPLAGRNRRDQIPATSARRLPHSELQRCPPSTTMSLPVMKLPASEASSSSAPESSST